MVISSILAPFLLAIFSSAPVIEQVHYLEHRLSPYDKRYTTFDYVLHECERRNVKTIVETGTARNGSSNCEGDGCSTVILADWASHNNATLYSVDIYEGALINAQKALGEHSKTTIFVHGDSITFLKSFPKSIDLLYLDSFDFEEHNPRPSQFHHLREIEAAYPHLTENSIVMIDDCALPHGGKGVLAINYLLNRGWTIVKNDYQVVLVKNVYRHNLKT